MIPLWPEIEAVLSVLFDKAKVGEPRVITKYIIGQKLGTQFSRIIRQAGFEVWAKPIQNLRASCQNDLEEAGFRLTAVCSWIGNSKPVAQKHYLKVTDSDFDKALGDSVVTQMVPHGTASASTKDKKYLLNQENTPMPSGASICEDPKREKHPLKDSNLCFRSERTASWATRRRGHHCTR